MWHLLQTRIRSSRIDHGSWKLPVGCLDAFAGIVVQVHFPAYINFSAGRAKRF